MMICRMLSPGLLAALMHAESWVDHEDTPKKRALQSDSSLSKSENKTVSQYDQRNSDYISRTEQALHRSLFLS
jgi:hypothetical protein